MNFISRTSCQFGITATSIHLLPRFSRQHWEKCRKEMKITMEHCCQPANLPQWKSEKHTAVLSKVPSGNRTDSLQAMKTKYPLSSDCWVREEIETISLKKLKTLKFNENEGTTNRTNSNPRTHENIIHHGHVGFVPGNELPNMLSPATLQEMYDHTYPHI